MLLTASRRRPSSASSFWPVCAWTTGFVIVSARPRGCSCLVRMAPRMARSHSHLPRRSWTWYQACGRQAHCPADACQRYGAADSPPRVGMGPRGGMGLRWHPRAPARRRTRSGSCMMLDRSPTAWFPDGYVRRAHKLIICTYDTAVDKGPCYRRPFSLPLSACAGVGSGTAGA